MPVPTLISDLSQTAGSNYPDGSESPIVLDNFLRAHGSFIAMLRDGKGFTNPVTLASGATCDIGGQNSLFVEISGTTGITSFGTNYYGPRLLRFTGVLTLTHASALNLPGAANITTAAGDTAIAVPNLALNGWNVVQYQRAAGLGVPAGTIIDFAGDSAPAGFLACPLVATNISRTTYATLFAAIGTTWGVGDGSTTFGMPYFPANYAGVQANSNVGDATTGEVKSHMHNVPLSSEMAAGGNSGSLRVGDITMDTSETGGTANLAAGMRVLKCVKT